MLVLPAIESIAVAFRCFYGRCTLPGIQSPAPKIAVVGMDGIADRFIRVLFETVSISALEDELTLRNLGK